MKRYLRDVRGRIVCLTGRMFVPISILIIVTFPVWIVIWVFTGWNALDATLKKVGAK